MKKLVAAVLTLCLVSVVVPPAADGEGNDAGISTYAYSIQTDNN